MVGNRMRINSVTYQILETKMNNSVNHKKSTPFKWIRKTFSLRVRTSSWTSGWRLAVQTGFLLSSLFMGWQFWRFYSAAVTTTTGDLSYRPPGVEGYLPISGLMGAIDWFYQGSLNIVHPAATILFLTFLGMSILLRKAFCGWICPVGFISENLARVGQLIFGRNFRPSGIIDNPLRSIKYLLLGFFVWAIFSMTPTALHSFIESPYNKIADIKMMLFFVNIGKVGGIILAALAGLSIFIQGFWCRYLCPYGALLGLFSWISPFKVRRDPISCIDCGLCDKVCPARLPVMTKLEIISPECIGCADCVTSCPVKGALLIGIPERSFNAKRLAVLIVLFFVIGYSAARVGGVWSSGLTDDDYRYHIQNRDGEEYGHPGR